MELSDSLQIFKDGPVLVIVCHIRPLIVIISVSGVGLVGVTLMVYCNTWVKVQN